MRPLLLSSVAAFGGVLLLSSGMASAGDLGRHSRMHAEDPYAYSFTLPRYYPYYNSGYWVPRVAMRYRYRNDTVLPPYQSSWGYPLPPDRVRSIDIVEPVRSGEAAAAPRSLHHAPRRPVPASYK